MLLSNHVLAMKASGYGHKDVVKLLLEKGAETRIKDKQGNTALDYASRKRHKTVATLLKNAKER